MANYINKNIVGDGITVSNARGFRAIKKTDIGSPVYDAKYFETFPTVWASAYAFSRELSVNGNNVAVLDSATEEWATLFLLHFFGVVNLHTFSQTELQDHTRYDRDLWLALSGTYPDAGDNSALDALHLLETDAGTIVGAYYPDTVFFPCRGRSLWPGDRKLQPYLRDNHLSWAQSREILIKTEHERDSFREHLQLVARYALTNNTLRSRLQAFNAREFPSSSYAPGGEETTKRLHPHPAQWFDIPGNRLPTAAELLDRYPLRQRKAGGGYTYFLVDKMPQHEAWMSTMTPAPYQYIATDSYRITVQYARTPIPCPLQPDDEIVQLETLFLDARTSPYWCGAPTKNDAHVSLINQLHRSDVADPRVTHGDKVSAAFLAPISVGEGTNKGFLHYFPEAARTPNAISKTVTTDQSGKVTAVDWKFTILDKEITWRTKPICSGDLKGSSLAMYPPRTSTQWHLYAAYGIGDKNKCGRWNLVDEQGQRGDLIEVDEDEYVTVLQGAGDKPNRPRYMLLTDSEGQERGVLFLAGIEDISTQNTAQATLAVDFGTSNTCLAFKNGNSAVLKFKLSPERLWGARPLDGAANDAARAPAFGSGLGASALENPGFVPFAWGGDKGYFPTILLSRKSDPELSDALNPRDLKIKHLFEVDIPGLHKGMEERLNEGVFNRVWNAHWNLKWELKDSKSEPWRTLFLQLLLMYAHTEMFFVHGARLDGYTFTFPLAFNQANQDAFHTQAQEILRTLRQYCYGTDPTADTFNYVDNVDESTAIANAFRFGADTQTMDVFIDIGGGSADYAVRYNNRFLVLDSIEVAGRTFFKFGKKNLESDVELNGAVEFRRHLGKLIQGKDNAEFKIVNTDPNFDLGVAYSVGINALDDKEFAKRESSLLERTMGDFSYQRYRTQLFFRHILAYGLVQACAAAVDGKLKLASGINLVLSGNGWGLMLFADMSRKSDALRKDASHVLDLLKRELAPTLAEEERPYLDALKIYSVKLLNSENLSMAKTSVALGALHKNIATQNGEAESTTPYAGITVNNLSVNNAPAATVRWCERWGMDEFREKFGSMIAIREATFEPPASTEHPLDPTLGVFTLLGNPYGDANDGLPSEAWTSMNGEVSREIRGLSGARVEGTPINHFISKVLYAQDTLRDFLDQLAEEHDHYTKSKSKHA